MLITINRRAVYLHNPDPSITVGRLSAPACLHSGCLHYVIASAAKQSVCDGSILGHGGRYVYEDCFVAKCAPRKDIAITYHCERSEAICLRRQHFGPWRTLRLRRLLRRKVRSSQRHCDHLSLRAQRSNLSATAAFWAMADVTFTKIASSQSALLATTLRSLVIASPGKAILTGKGRMVLLPGWLPG